MRRLRLRKIFNSEDKWRNLSMIFAALLLIMVGIVAGQEINKNKRSPLPSSYSNQPLKSQSAINTNKQDTANTSSTSTNTTPPASSASRPNTTSNTPTSTPATTPAPATLPNCTYSNGTKAGTNCPQTAPSSYSFSNYNPYYCFIASNPGGPSTACPPYEDVITITGTYDSGYGSSYCQFYYSDYNGVSGIMKSDRVNNYSNPGSVPDCSTATLYY